MASLADTADAEFVAQLIDRMFHARTGDRIGISQVGRISVNSGSNT
jgi:hypothetical protein